jgi:hypothetical protein
LKIKIVKINQNNNFLMSNTPEQTNVNTGRNSDPALSSAVRITPVPTPALTPVPTTITTAPNLEIQQNQGSASVFRFTDLNSVVNSLNFPDKASLNECFFQENFNRLLHLVRTRMIDANTFNNNFCRILNPDTANYKPNVVTSVKSFLIGKGYVISEIETPDGIPSGWKLTW